MKWRTLSQRPQGKRAGRPQMWEQTEAEFRVQVGNCKYCTVKQCASRSTMRVLPQTRPGGASHFSGPARVACACCCSVLLLDGRNRVILTLKMLSAPINFRDGETTIKIEFAVLGGGGGGGFGGREENRPKRFYCRAKTPRQ